MNRKKKPRMTSERAREIARRLVGLVQGTSSLEGQGLDKNEIETLVQRSTKRILKSKRKQT